MRTYDQCIFDVRARNYFGGGGGGGKSPPPQQQYTPPPVPAYTPPPPPPPPEPIPPIATSYDSQTAADTEHVQQQAALKRKGFRKTILAGETGGYTNPVTGKSLLG